MISEPRKIIILFTQLLRRYSKYEFILLHLKAMATALQVDKTSVQDMMDGIFRKIFIYQKTGVANWLAF